MCHCYSSHSSVPGPLAHNTLETCLVPTVTRVRKQLSADGTHWHIEGVCTEDGTHYSRADVAARIDGGESWSSSAGGAETRIRTIVSCPMPPCSASPYLTTAPEHTAANNLENLPRC